MGTVRGAKMIPPKIMNFAENRVEQHFLVLQTAKKTISIKTEATIGLSAGLKAFNLNKCRGREAVPAEHDTYLEMEELK